MRQELAADPQNPVAWYLLGCSQARSGRIKDAARCFGMAYHLDVDIESAALLTFACLKSRDGEGSDFLDQVVVTWDEMKRPDIHASSADRELSEILGEADAPSGLSALGLLAWCVASEPLRAEIDAARDDTLRQWKSLYQ